MTPMRWAAFLAMLAFPAFAEEKAAPAAAEAAIRGERFVQEICGECHDTKPNSYSSPRMTAPPFANVAKKPEVDEAWIRVFLRSPHMRKQMPENLNLTDRQVGYVVSYFAKLR
jgi:mono/diheme cytochrome c family protein